MQGEPETHKHDGVDARELLQEGDAEGNGQLWPIVLAEEVLPGVSDLRSTTKLRLGPMPHTKWAFNTCAARMPGISQRCNMQQHARQV